MSPLLLALAVVAAAPPHAHPPEAPSVASAPAAKGKGLTLVFTGDNGGQVAPCG